MATLTTGDPRPDAATRTRGQRSSTALFWFGMPAFLIAVWVVTYLVISSRKLDDIERRTLVYSQLRDSTIEHLQLTVASTVIVILIAIPLGIVATRPFARRAVPGILGVANIGQGVPSYGLLAIVVVLWTVGFWPVIIGLVAYSALPIVRNTMVGLQQVDRNLIKASRGMGMSAVHVLFRVELPLAIPVMIAGIRTALILNVGTATLATFFAGGGLGYIIFNGIQLNRSPVLYTGVIMVSSLALLVDYLGKAAGRLLAPKGI